MWLRLVCPRIYKKHKYWLNLKSISQQTQQSRYMNNSILWLFCYKGSIFISCCYLYCSRILTIEIEIKLVPQHLLLWCNMFATIFFYFRTSHWCGSEFYSPESQYCCIYGPTPVCIDKTTSIFLDFPSKYRKI